MYKPASVFTWAFIALSCNVTVTAQSRGKDAPQSFTFTTLVTTPRSIEGLTGDNVGNLFLAASGAAPCPIWRVSLGNPSLVLVGSIPASLITTCNVRGLAFDGTGALFILDQTVGKVFRVAPNPATPGDATLFATGVPGANGLAFDRQGNVWVSDGNAAQGRVWKITGPAANCVPGSLSNCTEAFRIQPMRNSVALGGAIAGDGVGRQVREFPPGTLTITSGTLPITPAGGQDLVANGVAFDRQGNLFVIDTARGALWKVTFDESGAITSPRGCDTTFAADTLCLSNIAIQHPILEGGDGIALDQAENIWVSANERNAIAFITKEGTVTEVFRNPVNAAGLRNSADTPAGNAHILEFPTSPFLTGRILCTTNSDLDRRDNSPAAAGEVNGATVLGKVSCMDQAVAIPGLPLPVR
jgi:sugar lactone lactonase YvrE